MISTFELNPYGTKLIVVVDRHPGKASTKLNIERPGIDIDYPSEYVMAVTFERFYKGKGDRAMRQYIVVVVNRDYATPSTIAHEAVHVVNYIYAHVGMEPDADNDEHQAYMVGHVVEYIWETVKKSK